MAAIDVRIRTRFFKSTEDIWGEFEKLKNESLAKRKLSSMRIDKPSLKAGYLTGDFVRFRDTLIPEKARPDTDKTRIKLSAGESMTESAAFRYDKKSRVLAIQFDRYANPSAFCSYFHERLDDLTLELRPVLAEDALKRILKMDEYKRVELQFADLSNVAGFLKSGSVSRALEIAEDARAAKLTLTIASNQRQGFLKRSFVADIAKRVGKALQGSANAQHSIRRLRVTGLTDGEIDHLDLMLDVLAEVEVVPSSSRPPTLQERLSCVQSAWDRNNDYLSRY